MKVKCETRICKANDAGICKANGCEDRITPENESPLHEDFVESYIRELTYEHPRHWTSADVETIVAGNIRTFAARLHESNRELGR